MTTTSAAPVHRFVVRPRPLVGDPRAAAVKRVAKDHNLSPSAIDTASVYLIQADLSPEDAQRLREELLADPVAEAASDGRASFAIEVHPLPGVMDPAAQSLESAILDLLGVEARASTGKRYEFSGIDPTRAKDLIQTGFANTVVHHVHEGDYHPDHLPEGHTAEFKLTHVPIRDLRTDQLNKLSRDAHLFLDEAEMLAIQSEYQTLGRDPTDIELETLAQTWSEHCVHKTLKSTIKYTPKNPGRKPGEGLASDPINWANRPGHELHPDGSITIHNLLKSTVAAATHELIEEGLDWTLSVFVDNAGIVKLDDDHAVCVKVETHNHPSALEPYGGAATGIGGCIRDIIGTGLAAKPIANTDVFCVGTPNGWHGSPSRAPDDPTRTPDSRSEIGATTKPLPEGCIHPKRILSEVVAGVRDYGNRMGIPTLNGAVWFDDRHVGNPLVFAGSIGLIPNHLTHGDAQPGDLIVALGGRTGRDGIHGATFSSAELTDTHADEFSHAVQIGNAIEEKRVLDAILRARDYDASAISSRQSATAGPESRMPNAEGRTPTPLFSAITDCGAGGFSSAVGEMGEKVGAEVHLDRAPLKYAGLTYTEIWISEAQERMVLAVPPANLEALQQICNEEHVELAVLGEFGRTGDQGPELVLNYQGTEVGRLPMPFLHDGIPTPTREAAWSPTSSPSSPPGGGVSEADGGGALAAPSTPSTSEALLHLLAHPNIASKHSIIRQYDHEVQGRTVLKPLVGPGGRGPGDAAVVEPVPGSGVGLAIGCGLTTGLEQDSYLMALAAIDECVRNLVCVGADPDRIAILDNFCWPSCKKPENLGSLVRAAEGCYDAAKAYKTPFVSGKDSLNNQFTTKDGQTIEIPPTLLITGIGRVTDINRCVTMDAKKPGNMLFYIEPRIYHEGTDEWSELTIENYNRLGGSHYLREFGQPQGASSELPAINLAATAATARFVAEQIASGSVAAAHDCSDGGLLCAIAEMLIAGSSSESLIGAEVEAWAAPQGHENADGFYFGERPSGYIIEATAEFNPLKRDTNSDRPFYIKGIGKLTASGSLDFLGTDESVSVADLAAAWTKHTFA